MTRYIDKLEFVDLEPMLAAPTPPRRYVWDGLLEARDVVNLAAMWGHGKSWLALDLALHVADEGRDTFLGRKVLIHGPVLYLDGEGSTHQTVRRLKMLGAGPELAGSLKLKSGPLALGDDESNAGALLLDSVNKLRPVLVILDPFVRFMGWGSENDSGPVSRMFSDVFLPIRDLGAALMILDHTRKTTSALNPELSARGSGDKLAMTDRIMTVETADEPRGLIKVNFGRAKNDQRPEPFSMRRLIDDEAGTARHYLPGIGELERLSGGKTDPKIERLVFLLREARDEGRTVTKKDLAPLLGYADSSGVNTCIKRAQKAGYNVKRELGHGGQGVSPSVWIEDEEDDEDGD